jgi:hypothetical protein
MLMRVAGLLLILLSSLTACKSRPDESALRSVGQANAGGDYVVYYFDTSVHRKTCSTRTAVMSYANCPGTEKSWADVKNGLSAKNYDSGDIDKIKDLLSDWTLLNASSPEVLKVMKFADLEEIFGFSASGTPVVVGGAPAKVTVPPPSTPDSALAMPEVLAAMKQIKSTYNMDLNQYVIPCLDNDTPHWSDIVIHYYCLLGQPRQCFTPAARANSKDLAGYEKAYEGCKDNSDFKWVSQNQPDVFRYIMYSVYTPAKTKTFRQEDQDKVINDFYGITDPENATECNKRPRRKNETRPAGQHCGKRYAGQTPPVAPVNPAPVNPTPVTPAPNPPVNPQPVTPPPQPSVNCGALSAQGQSKCRQTNGCDWDGYNYECFSLLSTNCGDYSKRNQNVCKKINGCAWDGYNYECFSTKSANCSDYTKRGQTFCKQTSGCSWDGYNYECFSMNSTNCTDYTKRGQSFCRQVNNCAWDGYNYECYAKTGQCSSFTKRGQTPCKTAGCTWDGYNYQCK